MERLSDKVARLCQERDWFTGGDARAFAKLIDAVDSEDYSHKEIAGMIWVVSDDAYFSEILEDVTEAHEEYLNERNKVFSSELSDEMFECRYVEAPTGGLPIHFATRLRLAPESENGVEQFVIETIPDRLCLKADEADPKHGDLFEKIVSEDLTRHAVLNTGTNDEFRTALNEWKSGICVTSEELFTWADRSLFCRLKAKRK